MTVMIMISKSLSLSFIDVVFVVIVVIDVNFIIIIKTYIYLHIWLYYKNVKSSVKVLIISDRGTKPENPDFCETRLIKFSEYY